MAQYPDAPCRGVKRGFLAATAAWVLGTGLYVAGTGTAEAQVACGQTITANVVVLDNPTVFNRLGAQNPNWITYALKRDVVQMLPGGLPGLPCSQIQCQAGK